jgi:glycosyltransferase involved in cell wall biosynthesis
MSTPDVQPSQGGAPVKRAGTPLLTQSLSVVLPAHNEEANIVNTVSMTVHTLQQWVQDFEIVVVNDGSSDETGSLLASLQQQDARIRIITHPVNRGYGAALVSGFDAASKELIFFMDSDGQFDIADLQHFFPYAKNYDAVIGYRMRRQDSWLRKLNAWGWKMVVGLVLGVHVQDVDCAFKLYHADFLHRHHLETRGAMINAEVLYKLKQDGGTVKEIGVQHLPRRAGQATGANIKVILRAFRELWVYARRWKREERQYNRVVK